jgi:hypothetical protein
MPDWTAWPFPIEDPYPVHSRRPLLSAQAAVHTALMALIVYTALVAAAQAQTFATLTAVLSPDRLDAKAALTLTIRYSGGELGIPSPVRRAVLRFPAGLALDIPSLRSCSAASLEARGVHGCPTQSQIGAGQALVEANLGAQRITEDVALQLFLGPPRNLQPTFEILGQGYTPISQQVLLTATTLPDRPPYGEKLMMSIPPIPTLPTEHDASIASFSLTIGAGKQPRGHTANRVLVPNRCPAGGFPFAARFTYVDGSTGNALAKVPCPS